MEGLKKIDLPVKDEGYNVYKLEGEVKGDTLRILAAGFGGLKEKDLNTPDWDNVAADIKMDVSVYKSDWSMNITIESSDLAQVLLSAAQGVQSAENGRFSLDVSFSVFGEPEESSSIEKPEQFWEEGSVRMPGYAHADLLSMLLDDIYAEELEKGFTAIEETTDPVTMHTRGMAVTVTIPEGIRQDGTLELRQPNRAVLELRDWEEVNSSYKSSHGALWADFRLDSRWLEEYLDEGWERYLICKENSKYKNLEYREVGTVPVDMGEAQAIYYSYDYDEIHCIYYYAVLPLENNKVLCVELKSEGKLGDAGNICDDDTLRAIFNHCSIDTQASQKSGSNSSAGGTTQQQSGEAKSDQETDKIADAIENLECGDALSLYGRQSKEVQDSIREPLQKTVTDVWKNNGYNYIYNSVVYGETGFLEDLDVMKELAGILGFAEADPEIQMLNKAKELEIHMQYRKAQLYIEEYNDNVNDILNELNAQGDIENEEIAQYFYQIEALSIEAAANIASLKLEDEALEEDTVNLLTGYVRYYNAIGQAYEAGDQSKLDKALAYGSNEIAEMEEKCIGRLQPELEAINNILQELANIADTL